MLCKVLLFKLDAFYEYSCRILKTWDYNKLTGTIKHCSVKPQDFEVWMKKLITFSVRIDNPASHEVWFYRWSCSGLSKQYKSQKVSHEQVDTKEMLESG